MRLLDAKKLILSTLCVFAFTVGATSQTKSDTITSAEIKEANALAHRFAKRLLETRDVRKLIGEFFVSNYSQSLSQDTDQHYWQFLRRDQIKPEKRKHLFRYYVAETNFLYLFMLMATSRGDGMRYSTIDEERGDNEAIAAFVNDLPASVRSIFAKNDATWKLMGRNEESFDIEKPESSESAIAYFDRALRFLEQIYPELRRAAVRINAGRGATFRKNMLELSKNGDLQTYKPIELDCDNPCYGFKRGTRMTYIEFLPMFQLTLARVAGKLKVVDFNFAVP